MDQPRGRVVRRRALALVASVACLGAFGAAAPAQAAVPFAITVAGPADFYPRDAIRAFTGQLTILGAVGVPNQAIELQLDGNPLVTGLTDATGGYSLTLPPINDTLDHTVTAVAFKGTPLETSASVALKIRRFVLAVFVHGNGSGTLTSTVGIACPPTCSVVVPATAPVSLTASPAEGSIFSGWYGECIGFGRGDTCTFQMTYHREVPARFDTPARIAVSPPSWNIPDLDHDQTAQMTFTVTNVGGSVSGWLAVTLSNNDGSFLIVGDSCSGGNLAPQQSCQVTVKFHQRSLSGNSNGANLAISGFPEGSANIQMTGG